MKSWWWVYTWINVILAKLTSRQCKSAASEWVFGFTEHRSSLGEITEAPCDAPHTCKIVVLAVLTEVSFAFSSGLQLQIIVLASAASCSNSFPCFSLVLTCSVWQYLVHITCRVAIDTSLSPEFHPATSPLRHSSPSLSIGDEFCYYIYLTIKSDTKWKITFIIGMKFFL